MSKSYDVIIVGGGIAGLSCAISALDAGKSVAIVSKVHPLRSHSGAAQGGIAAPLGTLSEDSVQWHMEDTLRGGDGLADRLAVSKLCENAEDTINWLNSQGVPFSRNADGTIAQRLFGGHTAGDGETPTTRACFAADRIGLAILNTLWRQVEARGVALYYDSFVEKLIKDEDRVVGIQYRDRINGKSFLMGAGAVVLATGGYGQVYDFTSNPRINTGDGAALVLELGGTLQDMEFIQFHPTGLFPKGHLISEAARAEGATLRNHAGSAFMETYEPKLKELAPRDRVSRAVFKEMHREDESHQYIDMRELATEVFEERIPQICELIETFAAVDPQSELVPIAPVAHYSMGGIPTTLQGEVLLDGEKIPCKGLYAVGECASVSVHGANRLGGNSLLEAALFGRKCGLHLGPQPISKGSVGSNNENEDTPLFTYNSNYIDIKKRLKKLMSMHCGVIREGEGLQLLQEKLQSLSKELSKKDVTSSDLSHVEAYIAFRETVNLLTIARAVVTSAQWRKESRGSHFRSDFPEKREAEHSLYSIVEAPAVRSKAVDA